MDYYEGSDDQDNAITRCYYLLLLIIVQDEDISYDDYSNDEELLV